MNRLFAAILIGLAAISCLAEEPCEPIVDLADSMNVNAHHDCNQEKTGLNRLVHKMLRKDSVTSSSTSPVAGEVEVAIRSQQASSLVNNASELTEARYQLLLTIGQKCLKGFRLTGEQYLPADGHLRVSLLYECL